MWWKTRYEKPNIRLYVVTFGNMITYIGEDMEFLDSLNAVAKKARQQGASVPMAALVTAILFGCASAPNSTRNHTNAPLPKTPSTTVSPEKYPSDPVGYATAVLGSPGSQESEGRYSWRAERSRYQEIRKAMESWCKYHGGKLPPAAQILEACTDSQGKTLTRFTVAVAAAHLGVMVEAPAFAQQQALQRSQTLASHQQYVASNGARGSITLVDGQRFEVLRFGSVGAPIDYSINSVDGKDTRRLRDVVSARRTAPAAEGTAGSFEFRFADGTTTSNKHLLSNAYSELMPDGVMRGTAITFGGILSQHMLLVVRSNPQAKPKQVRIVIRDIATLQIDLIDTQPRSPIAVQGNDENLAATLLTRWTRAVAGKPIRAYTRTNFEGPNWCSSISHGTIESSLVCQQLWAEHEIAMRAGILSPSTTPATLAGEGIYELARRTLM